MNLRHRAFELAFRAISLVQADRWATPMARGRGVILTLHRVREPISEPFQPNGILEVSPGFLDSALAFIRQAGIDLVTMDEAVSRLETAGSPFFAALTFDDGFRDTLDAALPILRRHDAPATVYCVPGFASRTAPLWWADLEEIIRKLPLVEVTIGSELLRLAADTPAAKARAFDAIYWRLRALPEPALRSIVAELSARAGHDSAACADRLCLDWAGLALLARDPLVTIGAHTMTHPRLAKLDLTAAEQEMQESRSILAGRLGVPVRHLAYPVGDPTSASEREFNVAAELGFASGVTTRPGHLHARHVARMTALPRVSLNGLHQNRPALRAILSGLPFAGMKN